MNPIGQSYEIKSEYAGKTLKDIGDLILNTTGQGIGRPDVLSGFLGINETSPLPASFSFNTSNLPSHFFSSAEGVNLGKVFNTFDPAVRAQEQAKKARQQAIAPAVSSLEASIPEQSQKFATERTRLQGEVDPIKQRYQLALDELKRRETRDTGEVNTSLAREFGKRGIPLSSGLYDETGIEKRRPISEFYTIQQRETGASQEDNLRNITNLINQLVPQETEANRTIRNAIANLQAGAGNASIEDAFNQLQFQESQRQYNQNLALQQAQQEVDKRLAEDQIANYKKPAQTTAQSPFTVGQNSYVFDPTTGKFLSPPATSGGGGFSTRLTLGGGGNVSSGYTAPKPTYVPGPSLTPRSSNQPSISNFIPITSQLSQRFGGQTAARLPGINLGLLQTLGYK